MNFKSINLMSMNFKLINLMSMNFKLVNLKLVVLFSAFWCFLVLVKSYRKKKNKKFKTDLITLFILLLSGSKEILTKKGLMRNETIIRSKGILVLNFSARPKKTF